ncbi:peroxisomal catalase [Physcia stellaris]|nr:peroxisomal catalase [Physcia stellaris]
MPLYKVQHSCPLSTAQQDELAAAITELHTQKFTAPSLFVNVTFTDTSSQPTYVAGKRTTKNSILAHVRHGPSRSQEAYNELCESIHEAWDRIVLIPTPASNSSSENEATLELNTVFIFGDIVAGREAGLAIPPAGEDERWVRENMGVLRGRAEGG